MTFVIHIAINNCLLCVVGISVVASSAPSIRCLLVDRSLVTGRTSSLNELAVYHQRFFSRTDEGEETERLIG